MNTYDLADRLEEFYSGTHIQKAAETLRELQKQNDALNEKIVYLEAKVYGGTTK